MLTKLPARLLWLLIHTYSIQSLYHLYFLLWEHKQETCYSINRENYHHVMCRREWGRLRDLKPGWYIFKHLLPRYTFQKDTSSLPLTGTVDRWDVACHCSKAGICFEFLTMKVDRLQSTCPPSLCLLWQPAQTTDGHRRWKERRETSTFNTLTGIHPLCSYWHQSDWWQDGGSGAEHDITMISGNVTF